MDWKPVIKKKEEIIYVNSAKSAKLGRWASECRGLAARISYKVRVGPEGRSQRRYKLAKEGKQVGAA